MVCVRLVMFLPWGLEDLTGPVARSNPVHPLKGASRPSRPSTPTSTFSSASSLCHSLTYSRSRDPSETLRTLLPRVTLTTYWPCLPNGTLKTTSALKQTGISPSLWSSCSSDDVTGRVLTLSPFMPAFPSFPGFPRWPCQEQNFKTRQPECALTVH